MQTTFSRTLISLAVALGVSATAFAAKVPEGTQLAEKQEITINNGTEPQSLDPHKIEGVPESQVAFQLLEGLVTKGSDGEEQPGVAESWTNTPDFKVWTFTLRKDAKWSNGEPVTAHDFVYAWQRLANPTTASPYSSYLDYMQVENAQDILTVRKNRKNLA